LLKKKLKVVMGGSGALYPMYLGCLCRLKDEGFEIKKVGGTSGGAISATVWASPAVKNEKNALKKFLCTTSPKNNKNIISYSLIHFFKKWGLIDGKPLEEHFENVFFSKLGQAETPLEIYTVNIQRNKRVIFSSDKDPDLSLPKVLRASCSIPLIFDPVEINGKKYIDGGWSAPLPIASDDHSCLGMRIKKSRESYITTGLIDYMQNILYKKIEMHDADKPEQNNILELFSKYDRTKLTNSSEKDVCGMFDEGYEQMGIFLNERAF